MGPSLSDQTVLHRDKRKGFHARRHTESDEIPEHLDAIGQPPAGWKAPDLGVRLPLDLIREPNTPAVAVTLGLNLAR